MSNTVQNSTLLASFTAINPARQNKINDEFACPAEHAILTSFFEMVGGVVSIFSFKLSKILE